MDDELGMSGTEATTIDPTALTEEMVRVPADLAFWNERYANVYEHWLSAKFARERAYSDAFKFLQDTLQMTAKGRVTVAEVEHGVLTNSTYVTARMEEIAIESEKVRLCGLIEAVRAKKDMLVSIGAHVRAEMGSQMINTRWQPSTGQAPNAHSHSTQEED